VDTEGFWGSVKEEARKNYIAVFEQDWPTWLAGIFIAILALLMFLWQSPWGIVGGYRNWGDWFFYFLGANGTRPEVPWINTMSVSNFGLFSGALASAMLSRQFKVRRAPGIEYVKGIAGGVFMGTGAAFAGGCNVGGFYTAIGVFSMGGYAMMAGLGAGAYIGLRYLLWEMEKFPPKMTDESPKESHKAPRIDWGRVQPWIGASILAAAVAGFYLYSAMGKTQIGGLLFFGLLIGLVMHRSRFCFVRAFRCPFMTGDAEMVRVVAMSLMIYGLGSAVIKWNYLQPEDMGVYHPFWFGSLIGGVIFGVGMLLAGGCGSSTLWRIGEGHTKLVLTLIAFALTNSSVNRLMDTVGINELLGKGIFVPEVFTWSLTIPLFLLVLLFWALAAIWNEKTEKLVIF
jgi:uncharacterized membrane protein YedE/YeeE